MKSTNHERPQKNAPTESEQRNRRTNLKVEIAPHSPDVDVRWTELRISGKNIHARSFHSCCVYDNWLYIYGGYEVDSGVLGDFWRLNLGNQEGGFRWEILPADKHDYPGKLRSHTAVAHSNSMYLFGGQRNVGQNSNLTYVYSFVEREWKVIAATEKEVPALDSHSAVVLGQNMLIFGGYFVEAARHNPVVYALDLSSEKWSKFYEPQKGEQHPSARCCFGLTSHDDTVWLFGGTQGISTLNDLWKFDAAKRSWEKLSNHNTVQPQPRRNTSLTYYKGHLFVFGGIQAITKEKNDIYVYEVATGRWSKIHSSTNSIYQCSPTMKKKPAQKGHDRRSSSPVRSSRGLLLLKSGDESHTIKEKTGKLTKEEQSQVMKKIIEETKHKKFVEKKRQMLKEFEDAKQQPRPRKLSPTSENMKKTLQVIGDQEFNMEPLNHEVRYDETGRYILGKKPCARDGHSAVLHANSMLIFGGDRHLMSFCDLYAFDLDKGLQSKALYEQKQQD